MAQRNSLSGATFARSVAAVPVSQTSRYILRPGSDITAPVDSSAGWGPTGGSTNWGVLDDPIEQPTVGSPATDDYTKTSNAGPVTAVVKFLPTSGIGSREVVTSITLWVLYGVSSGGLGGTFSAALLRGDGSALATMATDTNVSSTTLRWGSVTFTGALAHSQLDQLRFSLTASTSVNTWTVYTAYAVVNTGGQSGGVFDGAAQTYSDANAPETLMQTQTTDPPVPGTGLAVSYVTASDGVPRTKTDAGLVSRQITEAEYGRVVRMRPTILTAPVTINGSTSEAVLASAVIPAGVVVVGTTYRVKLAGTASTSSATAVTMTGRMRVGANTGAALSGTVVALGAAASSAVAKTTVPFELDCILTFRAAGSSGTVIGTVTPGGQLFGAGSAVATAGITAAQTANTTADLRIEVTIQNSATALTGVLQIAAFEPIQP